MKNTKKIYIIIIIIAFCVPIFNKKTIHAQQCNCTCDAPNCTCSCTTTDVFSKIDDCTVKGVDQSQGRCNISDCEKLSDTQWKCYYRGLYPQDWGNDGSSSDKLLLNMNITGSDNCLLYDPDTMTYEEVSTDVCTSFECEDTDPHFNLNGDCYCKKDHDDTHTYVESSLTDKCTGLYSCPINIPTPPKDTPYIMKSDDTCSCDISYSNSTTEQLNTIPSCFCDLADGIDENIVGGCFMPCTGTTTYNEDTHQYICDSTDMPADPVNAGCTGPFEWNGDGYCTCDGNVTTNNNCSQDDCIPGRDDHFIWDNTCYCRKEYSDTYTYQESTVTDACNTAKSKDYCPYLDDSGLVTLEGSSTCNCTLNHTNGETEILGSVPECFCNDSESGSCFLTCDGTTTASEGACTCDDTGMSADPIQCGCTGPFLWDGDQCMCNGVATATSNCLQYECEIIDGDEGRSVECYDMLNSAYASLSECYFNQGLNCDPSDSDVHCDNPNLNWSTDGSDNNCCPDGQTYTGPSEHNNGYCSGVPLQPVDTVAPTGEISAPPMYKDIISPSSGPLSITASFMDSSDPSDTGIHKIKIFMQKGDNVTSINPVQICSGSGESILQCTTSIDISSFSGTYTIYAIAIDLAGNMSDISISDYTRVPIMISDVLDSVPPTGGIIYPTDSRNISGTVPIIARYEDDSTIDNIVLYVDSVPVKTCTRIDIDEDKGICTVDIPDLTGIHTISSSAIDIFGNSSVTDAVSINVTELDTVTITYNSITSMHNGETHASQPFNVESEHQVSTDASGQATYVGDNLTKICNTDGTNCMDTWTPPSGEEGEITTEIVSGRVIEVKTYIDNNLIKMHSTKNICPQSEGRYICTTPVPTLEVGDHSFILISTAPDMSVKVDIVKFTTYESGEE